MDEATPGGPPARVVVELVAEESALAMTRAKQDLVCAARGRRDVIALIALCVVVGLVATLGYKSLAKFSVNGEFVFFGLEALGLFGLAYRNLRMRRRIESRYRDSLPLGYAVSVADDGLSVTSEDGEARYHWSAVTGVEAGAAGVMLLFSSYRALWLPARSFADAAALQAFAARAAALAGKPIGTLRRAGIGPGFQEPAELGSRAFFSNLAAGCGFLVLRVGAVSRLRVSAGQFVASVVAGLVAALVFDLVRVGWEGSLNWNALPAQLYSVPCLLLAAWGAAVGDRRRSVLAGALALSLIWLIVGTLLMAWVALATKSWVPAWLHVEGGAYFVWFAVVGWAALASIVALVRVLGLPAEERMAAVLAIILLFLLPLMLAQNEERLWVADSRNGLGDPAQQAAWKRRQQPAGEAVLYAQAKLLDDALAAIRPGQLGKPELFFLAIGGNGSQDVFKREVDSVRQLFAERYGADGHSLVLVNNPDTVLSQPIASVTALRRSLRVIAERMNRDEDVLFLFMTSHGSQDHRFDLDLWPYRFDELTPQILRAMLDEAGVKYRVVVVSACYSGGFVPPLAGDDTLVISASRADRNSHGCSHEAEWTFFGKAFFDEALRGERSFELAFGDAVRRVARREAAEGVTPSEPQMAVGAGIRRAMELLESQGRQ